MLNLEPRDGNVFKPATAVQRQSKVEGVIEREAKLPTSGKTLVVSKPIRFNGKTLKIGEKFPGTVAQAKEIFKYGCLTEVEPVSEVTNG
jgi:hypothetical protein